MNHDKSTRLDDITCEDKVEKLVLLMRRLGQTQYQFSKNIGVSNSLLNKVVNGLSPLHSRVELKINNYLERAFSDNADNLFDDEYYQ
ncbi:helix-turn-helix domain-containing protein [Bacillus altitudinis]|uniref:helix-turn-helix domain-containing protein n=1 Tax=Bacillus altitudinis TaxID=293387 RepID=UPI001C220DD2|nr:helix-turn-helix domain-containing protein [Bacillus altitudinis]MBU8855231.1 hypothetical protein [Bacillus sp. FJAT-26377]MCY7454333.1 hypothetical protein [Bacillus altitudinis]